MPVHPLRRLTVATYPLLSAASYSAFEPFRPAVLISPPLVSLRRRTICRRGRGGAVAVVPLVGASFSPPTLLCRRRETASLRRPGRALGKRERSTAEVRLLASMRASEEAASRDGGRELCREEVGVPEVPRAAKEVDERGSTGGFVRPDDAGAVGSSTRSHMAVDWLRVMRSLPLPTNVGVPDIIGVVKDDFKLFGVGGVRPMTELTRVDPELEPDPSRRPADEVGRLRFIPIPDARDKLRFPLELEPRVFKSTSSQARTSSSAICRTRTAPSCSMSQLIRS